MVGFVFFGMATYLICTEFISAKRSKGEVLLFRRGQVPAIAAKVDEESASDDRHTAQDVVDQSSKVRDGALPPSLQKQTAVFHWEGVNYDIKIKGEPRRLLNEVDGWVKPGTLTALMVCCPDLMLKLMKRKCTDVHLLQGASGAGKTTLLDVLASRVTMGVVTGNMLVDGRERNSGFQRKTGYVQQQDLHLATSTVREALIFSSLLRQPKSVPKQEKLDYVEEVIKVLEMETYANAIVGVPGEGELCDNSLQYSRRIELVSRY